MKPAKVRREDNFMDEIVETLKSVPKTRLRIVRDVVGALAEASVRKKDGKRLKRAGRKSLLKNPILWNLARADGHRQRAVLRKEFEAKLGESWRQKLGRSSIPTSS